MKNFKYFLYALIFTPLSILAQERVYFDFGCNFNSGTTKGTYVLNEPNAEVQAIVDTIFRKLRILKTPIKLKAAEGIANAQATMRGNDRYILYSKAFVQQFKKDAKTTWSIYVVLAHEIGHHHQLHQLWETDPQKRQEMEMQADVYAAQILALMGATEAEALAALNTLVEENSPNYPKKVARIDAMKKAYNEQRAAMSKGEITTGIANQTEIGLDPKSFNRWSIVKKENVRALIDDHKVEIQLNDIPSKYQGKKLQFRLESLDGQRIQTTEGAGDYVNYDAKKVIFWQYDLDGVLKNAASRSGGLRLHAYTMGNPPHKSNGVTWGIVTSAVGVGGIAYSFVVRGQALRDHAIYKANKLESAEVYKSPNPKREALYQTANDAFVQSQIIAVVGTLVTAVGVKILITGFRKNSEAYDLGFAGVSKKRQWRLEPMVASTEFSPSNIGLRLRF